MKPVDRCSWCAANAFTALFEVRMGGMMSRVVHCDRCGLAFLDPRPDNDEIAALYSNEYFVDHVKPEILDSREKSATGLLRHLNRFLPARGRMLDIGAATGSFCAVFQKAGWEVSGIELSRFARESAKNIYGLTMYPDFSSANFQNDYFDCVLMSQVIEHMPVFSGVLHEVHRVMRSEGVLFVSTPNFDSPAARRRKAGWSPLRPFEHVTFFTPKTLRMVLVDSGFKIIRLDTMQAAVTTPHLKKIFGVARADGISKIANRLFPALKRSVRNILGKLYPGDDIQVIAGKV